MTACTSFLAFFAEQTLAFAVKMHSRPDRWPQIVRFASGRADSLANRRFVNDLKQPAVLHHRGLFQHLGNQLHFTRKPGHNRAILVEARSQGLRVQRVHAHARLAGHSHAGRLHR